MGLKGIDKVAKVDKLGKAGSSIPYNSMKTDKLKDTVKNNVYANMKQKAQQLEDLWKSNFGKEAIAKTIQAVSNSAVITKARNVLDPENIKAVAAKTYDDVIKGPITKTKTWANERLNKILDTPIGNTAFATHGPTAPTTIRDVIEQAKDSFSQIKVDGKGTGTDIAKVSGAKTLVDKGQQFTNGRKNKLKPDIRYKTGEYDYFYETDNLGRIAKFETENLQLTARTDRLSHSRNTPGKVKDQDHAGHLAGDRFGGSPKIDNLVSQLSDVNLKQYKKIEEEWAAALKETPPKKVTVDVEIIYSGDNVRPDKFKVRYTIDGISESVDIKN